MACKQTFAPYATELRGMDLSANMLERYNDWARNAGLYPAKMSAEVGNLVDEAGPTASAMKAEYFDFDLVAVGVAFHHFADPGLAAKRLVERLKPGSGVLLVLDFLRSQPWLTPTDHPANPTVSHHGFSEDTMRDMFVAAGCQDVRTIPVGKIEFEHEGHAFTLDAFLARGTRKPAAA